jgi:glycosyltransferase involved in cell wall biosynthesis
MLPALMLADRFVVLNAESERELVARVGARRVKRIPNGLEVPDQSWQLSGQGRLVFAAGRLDRQKGFDILIKACGGSATRVVIAGEGPERDALAALARRVGTELQLLGQVPRDEMTAWLLRAGLLAAPSRAEGMSNVVLEALAIGCPVIASDAPGNVDLVEHSHSGWLVPRDDPEALRAAIEHVFANSDLARKLGCQGAQRAAREFSIDRVAERYEALYRELCES